MRFRHGFDPSGLKHCCREAGKAYGQSENAIAAHPRLISVVPSECVIGVLHEGENGRGRIAFLAGGPRRTG